MADFLSAKKLDAGVFSWELDENNLPRLKNYFPYESPTGFRTMLSKMQDGNYLPVPGIQIFDSKLGQATVDLISVAARSVYRFFREGQFLDTDTGIGVINVFESYYRNSLRISDKFGEVDRLFFLKKYVAPILCTNVPGHNISPGLTNARPVFTFETNYDYPVFLRPPMLDSVGPKRLVEVLAKSKLLDFPKETYVTKEQALHSALCYYSLREAGGVVSNIATPPFFEK